MSVRSTIVIGEFNVAQANALSDGLFLSAVPPLTAWVGLGTALCLRLGEEVILNGIAPIIGETHLHRGHAKYVRYRTGQLSDVGSRGVQHPTIDDRRSSLTAYLLVDITSEEEIEPDDIKQALIGLRLAGGVIHPVTKEILIKVFQGNTGQTAQHRALGYLPSYFYVLEDAGRLVKLAREEVNGLRGFDILTAPMRRWAGDESEDELKKQLHLPERPAWLPGKGQGYYRPMAVGYQLLEAPQQRLGTRNNLPHAFAEPVFTLIRFRTVASIRKSNTPKSNSRYFWKQGVRAADVLGACPVATAKKSLF